MDWYPYFLGAVFVLWILSTPKDRNALRIIVAVSIFSELLVTLVTSQIPGAWKMAVYASIEMLTIAAMITAGGRTAYIQAVLLLIAWGADLLCYADTQLHTDFVYSRYETIILLVAIGQLVACHDTITHSLAGLCAFARNASSRLRGVPAPLRSTCVLRDNGNSHIQKIPSPCQKIS